MGKLWNSVSIFRKIDHLTHWGRVMHICISELSIIVSGNGLSSGRHQAIIWNNARILLIGPLAKNFSEISIRTFSLKKINLKLLFGKLWPFCLSVNMLMTRSHCIGETLAKMFQTSINHQCTTWSKNQAFYFNGLMQERCNSIANALELRLSCTNPSTCIWVFFIHWCLVIGQSGFMPWCDIIQIASSFLNQLWPCDMMHIWVSTTE